MIIVKDRYLYKLGGTTNIRKLEFLDLTTALQNIADIAKYGKVADPV